MGIILAARALCGDRGEDVKSSGCLELKYWPSAKGRKMCRGLNLR